MTNPTVLAKIQESLDEAIDISNERNKYIHDQWVFYPEKIKQGKISISKFTYTESGFLSGDPDDLTIDELYDFLKKLGGLQVQFSDFSDSL